MMGYKYHKLSHKTISLWVLAYHNWWLISYISSQVPKSNQSAKVFLVAQGFFRWNWWISGPQKAGRWFTMLSLPKISMLICYFAILHNTHCGYVFNIVLTCSKGFTKSSYQSVGFQMMTSWQTSHTSEREAFARDGGSTSAKRRCRDVLPKRHFLKEKG